MARAVSQGKRNEEKKKNKKPQTTQRWLPLATHPVGGEKKKPQTTQICTETVFRLLYISMSLICVICVICVICGFVFLWMVCREASSVPHELHPPHRVVLFVFMDR